AAFADGLDHFLGDVTDGQAARSSQFCLALEDLHGALSPPRVVRATASPILRVRDGYVTGEPSVAGIAARGRLALGIRGRAAAGGQQHGEGEEGEETAHVSVTRADAVRIPLYRVSANGARSSVGQSSGLIIRWSQVRVLAGPLTRISRMRSKGVRGRRRGRSGCRPWEFSPRSRSSVG